jgi:hypothetical protein
MRSVALDVHLDFCEVEGGEVRSAGRIAGTLSGPRGRAQARVPVLWCLLTCEGDYVYAQPSLTKKKLRRLQITAGANRYATPTPPASGTPTRRCAKPSASSPDRPRSPTRAR